MRPVHCLGCGQRTAPGLAVCRSCGTTQDTGPARPAEPGTAWESVERTLRTTMAGKYEVHGLLGHGGMAAVFLARDPKLRRGVAIKVMSPALMTDPRMVRRFMSEASTTARLRHPNIVTVFDVDERAGLHLFVMSYVAGRSLESVLLHEGELDFEVTRFWMVQIADALAHAHAHGIVHRDIKPANVLIDEDGQALVADFGIAKTADQEGLTRLGTMVGTPPYISPEQYLGREASPASDQYALGVLGYEMLTGSPPFTGSLASIARTHVARKAPRRLTELRPGCPEDLAVALHRMLSTDPRDRWPSLDEARRALGADSLARTDSLLDSLRSLARAIPGLVRGGSAAPDPAPGNRASVAPARNDVPPEAPGSTRAAEPSVGGGPAAMDPTRLWSPEAGDRLEGKAWNRPSRRRRWAAAAVAALATGVAAALWHPAAPPAPNPSRATAGPSRPAASEEPPVGRPTSIVPADPPLQPPETAGPVETPATDRHDEAATDVATHEETSDSGVVGAPGSGEGTGPEPSPAPPTVERVVVTLADDTVRVGARTPLTATASTSAGDAVADPPIAWDVDEPDVARVEVGGSGPVLVALAPGDVSVRATADGVTGTGTVHVVEAVTLLRLSPAGGSLAPGQTIAVQNAEAEFSVDGPEPAPDSTEVDPLLRPGSMIDSGRTYGPDGITERPMLLDTAAYARAVNDRYPSMFREAEVGGSVRLVLTIDRDGAVLDARVVESSGREPLDMAALEVVRTTRFRSARRFGQAVPTSGFEFVVSFGPAGRDRSRPRPDAPARPT